MEKEFHLYFTEVEGRSREEALPEVITYLRVIYHKHLKNKDLVIETPPSLWHSICLLPY
jgi:hypothetical protein